MICIFLACGYVLSCSLLTRERFIIKLWLGGAFGLVLMMWLPALCAFFVGFTIHAQYISLLLAILLSTILFLVRKPDLTPSMPTGLLPMLLCVLPLSVLSVYLLFHHTLRPLSDGLHTGQSGFGDMSMHLGFITSLARQHTFPPLYSIYPGTPLGYPFLCDSISASLYLLGAPLRIAYILPALIAMPLCFLGYYLLMLQWLGSRRKASLAFYLFFLGGGLGFAYFFDGLRENPENLTRLFTTYYQTPTNLLTENIRWVNPVADLMLPQRATLFGWVVLLPCLYLLYRLAFERGRNAIALGILAGSLPMIHTHSFLALGILSVALLFGALCKQKQNKALYPWFAYAFIALLLSLPQLLFWTFRQSSGDSFLHFQFNWGNLNDNYLWFYIKNIGLVFILLLPALLHTRKSKRALWLYALPIWVLAEIIVFQPNPYDNNKLLYVVHMLSCGLVAGYLVDLYRSMKGIGGRRLLFAMACFVGLLSGTLTLVRESVSDYLLFSAPQVEAARFIDQSLPADALLLTDDNHNNAPAALAGRNIMMGSPSYLHFHGFDDKQRESDRVRMLTEPGALEELRVQYGITHVYLSDFEKRQGAQEILFAQYPIVFKNDEITIFYVAN